MSTQLKAYLCFIFISIVWGTTWVANKYTVNLQVPPLQIAAIRHTIAGILLVLFFIIFKKEKLPTFQQFKFLFGMSILVFIISNSIANIALKYIPSGLAALIAALYPLAVLLIDYFIYKKVKITFLAILGIFLGITGIGLISFSDTNFHLSFDFWLGVALSVLAMISWSISTVIMSSKHIKMNNYYAIGWQMCLSACMLTIWLFITDGSIPFKDIPIKAMYSITYLIIFGSILAFIAFIYCIKNLKLGVVSLYAYVNPIVTIWVASFWVNETITSTIIFGSIVTLFGVYLVNKTLKEQKDEKEPIIEADGM